MRILVAYDGSDFSQAALEKAIPLAQNATSEIWLLMVLEPLGIMLKPNHAKEETGIIESQDVPLITQLEDEVEARGRKALARAEIACEEAGVTWHTLLRFGALRETILESVREKNIDVLVVGTRGMGRFKRFFLEAVTDYLVHNAPCSVLVVRSENS